MYIYIYIYALQYDYIPPTRHAVPSPCSPWTSLPPTAWRRPPSHLPDRGRCQSSEGGAINRVMHTSAAPRWKVRWDMAGLWNWSGWNTVNRWTWKIMPSSLYLWVSFLLRCRYYSSISCRILPCLPLSGRYCDSFYIYIWYVKWIESGAYTWTCVHHADAFGLTKSCRTGFFRKVDLGKLAKRNIFPWIWFSPWNNCVILFQPMHVLPLS